MLYGELLIGQFRSNRERTFRCAMHSTRVVINDAIVEACLVENTATVYSQVGEHFSLYRQVGLRFWGPIFKKS